MNIFTEGCIKCYEVGGEHNFTADDDFKHARGYGKVYHEILNHLGTDIPICELGIGNGGSHMRWSFITTGPVIGLELDSPDPKKEMLSVVDPVPQPNPNAQRNYKNAQAVIHQYMQDRADFRYESDAFDPNNAIKLVNDYPDLRFIINDSKHRPWAWKTFGDAWIPHVHQDAILVQEDMGRHPDKGFEYAIPEEIKKSVEAGWIVYDFRQHTTFRDPAITFEYCRASVIGVYYKNPAKWEPVLRPLDKYRIGLDNLEEKLHTFRNVKSNFPGLN
jgi:hypothetical protein